MYYCTKLKQMRVCVRACVRMCVRVCVCVCERDRELRSNKTHFQSVSNYISFDLTLKKKITFYLFMLLFKVIKLLPIL